MTRNNKKRNILQSFQFVRDLIKESKIKIILISIIVLIAFLTGIIVAIKTNANYESLNRLGIVCFEKGLVSSSFFGRLLSMIFVALLCFACSFCSYLFPLATLLLAYRGYLLGVNICLIISVNGLSGIVSVFLIALPCQLLALMFLTVFYILISKTNKDFKSFGGCKVPNQRIKILLCAFLILFVVCVIESIFLSILSPHVILVI